MRAFVILAGLLLLPHPALADVQDGVRAYRRGDYAAALREWRPYAEQGDAAAQYNLGVLYDQGQGVPQDYGQAVKWYRLAAEQGDADAQFNLGALYAKGQGVPQDYGQAVKWYRLAAEQGHASAQVNLGVRYANGQGVPQDIVQAAKWWRLAAEQGDAAARNNLGAQYQYGQGVPQDYVQAHKWYNLAAAAGIGQAAENRDDLARQMTAAQIAEAQRLAAGMAVGEPATGWNALSNTDIRAVQRALAAAGFDAGPADGLIGSRTRSALRAFQLSKGLPVGEPDHATLQALGLR